MHEILIRPQKGVKGKVDEYSTSFPSRQAALAT
jgi:hypothetical protein